MQIYSTDRNKFTRNGKFTSTNVGKDVARDGRCKFTRKHNFGKFSSRRWVYFN